MCTCSNAQPGDLYLGDGEFASPVEYFPWSREQMQEVYERRHDLMRDATGKLHIVNCGGQIGADNQQEHLPLPTMNVGQQEVIEDSEHLPLPSFTPANAH